MKMNTRFIQPIKNELLLLSSHSLAQSWANAQLDIYECMYNRETQNKMYYIYDYMLIKSIKIFITSPK